MNPAARDAEAKEVAYHLDRVHTYLVQEYEWSDEGAVRVITGLAEGGYFNPVRS